MTPHTKNAIGIVVSAFNKTITQSLLEGALTQLAHRSIHPDTIQVYWVPGAVEIPLMLQTLARTEQYLALIALGAVIQGETHHYDTVCQQVGHGCQQVSLSYHIPVAFGVLTTMNLQQAKDRAGGRYGNKGAEAVDVALHMVEMIQQVDHASSH